MMRMLRKRERVEHRVLGALQCSDATTLVPLDTPLTLAGDGVELVRNRSGLYVIWEWTGLAAHAPAFDSPPPVPAFGSEPLDLSVQDPSGRYLPRRARIALPRDPSPANAENTQSLFRPIDVPMYASPNAKVGANWVVLRVNVRETATRDALGGALLRVVSNGRVLARGLTDWRGEALVPVAGVPVTTWSDDPTAVIVTEIAASLEAVFDPAAGPRWAGCGLQSPHRGSRHQSDKGWGTRKPRDPHDRPSPNPPVHKPSRRRYRAMTPAAPDPSQASRSRRQSR